MSTCFSAAPYRHRKTTAENILLTPIHQVTTLGVEPVKHMVRRVSTGGGRRYNALPFSKRNYQIFFLGLGVIIAGYLVMASGETYSFRSLTLAPLMLLLGYCVLVPLAILHRKKGKKEKEQPSQGEPDSHTPE